MAQMKINTSIGSVIDPTTGLQTAMSSVADIMKMKQDAADKQTLLNRQAKLDAEKQQELQYQHSRQAVLDGYAKTQYDHANTLYDEKQNEYKLGVKNRNVLNTVAQNPGIEGANNIGKTKTDAVIQNQFAKGNAAAEKELAQRRSAGETFTSNQINNIYNKHNYGTTDPMKIDIINRQMQSVYDGNQLTQKDGRKILEKQIAIAGGDLTDPATQSYIKNTIATLPTQASFVAADEAKAKAINEANKQIIKNRQFMEKQRLATFKANNPTVGNGRSGGYSSNGYTKNGKYARGQYNTVRAALKAVDQLQLSTHTIQDDTDNAKNALLYLASKGANARDLSAYITGQVKYGAGWFGNDNTNSKTVGNFSRTDPKSTAALMEDYQGFLKKKYGTSGSSFGTKTTKNTNNASRSIYTMPKASAFQYHAVEGMSYPEIQAAQDKASADRIAALFRTPAKVIKKSKNIIGKGHDKTVLAPAIQSGSADRLQEIANAEQASKTDMNQNADLLKKIKDVPPSKTNNMLKLINQIDKADRQTAINLPQQLFKTAQKMNNTGYLSRKTLLDKLVDQGTKNTQSKMDKKLSRIMQLTRSSDFSKAYNRLSSPEKKRLKKLLGK